MGVLQPWHLIIILVIVLIVIRHVLTQRENDLLTNSLESRVVERTPALSGRAQWWRALAQNPVDNRHNVGK